MSSQLDFEALFNEFSASNQKVFKHDRSKTLGASETFGCLRKAWFSKRGAEFGFTKDEGANDSWGATMRGDIIENNFVVPAVRDHLPKGVALLFAGDDQETLVSGRNSATPDGLIVGLKKDALKKYGVEDIGADCIALEIKSIDPRVSLTEEKAIHHGQAQVQMGILRETTRFKPNYAVILYVDASFLDNIKVFVVPFDQKAWDAAKRRAATIWEFEDPGQIKPEGRIDGGCSLCPWQRACAIASKQAVPPEQKKYQFTVEAAEQMQDLVQRYASAKSELKAAEREFEEAKIAISEHLRDNDVRKMHDLSDPKKPLWKVSYTFVDGAKRLNQSKLLEALGDEFDVEPFYETGNGYEKVTVTLNE
ncbi:hypothetical protein [Microcystis phage Mwe-JY26]